MKNGFCRTLDCFYGAQPDGDRSEWFAIKVYRDGNPIPLGGPFNTEEEAEACAEAEHEQDLADNGQFGVGA